MNPKIVWRVMAGSESSPVAEFVWESHARLLFEAIRANPSGWLNVRLVRVEIRETEVYEEHF